MNQANLLPKKRVVARRRRQAIRRWIVIDAICAAFLLATGAALFIARSSPAATINPIASANMQAVTASFNRLTVQAAALKAHLQSVQDISSSPDWSLLLGVLSHEMGDDVVLESIDCNIAAVSVGIPPLATAHGLQMRGLGRSQKAVTDFAMRLEALKFFSEVNLAQTSPHELPGGALAGGGIVSFQVVCRLPDPAGGRK